MMTGVLSPSEIDFFSPIHQTDDGPDVWFSSLSVVESLFKDEKISLQTESYQVIQYNFLMDNQKDYEDNDDDPILFRLPSAILFRICGYFSPKDLAHLERVCKRLVPLATENSLWKELYMTRWKLLEIRRDELVSTWSPHREEEGDEESSQDEWAWIYSLLQQNERWKDIFKIRHSAEKWRIGTLKMFNGCWGFISQVPDEFDTLESDCPALDIFFHRKDICPDGAWFEDWWLQDTPGVSRSQKCGYWDTFLYGRKVRYKQRAAYAQGRRPQACQISFLDQERVHRDLMPDMTGYAMPPMMNVRVMGRNDVGMVNPKPRHHSPQKRLANYSAGYSPTFTPHHTSVSNYGYARSRR